MSVWEHLSVWKPLCPCTQPLVAQPPVLLRVSPQPGLTRDRGTSLGMTPRSVSTGARMGCGTLSFPASGVAQVLCLSILSIPGSSSAQGCVFVITPDHRCNDTSEVCGSPTRALREAEQLQAPGGSCQTPHCPLCAWLSLLCFRLCPSAADLAPGSASLLAHTFHPLQSRHSFQAAEAALIFPGKSSTDSSNSRCFITPIALGKYNV